MIRLRGGADQTIYFVAKNSAGDPFTLAYNTAGISVKYFRPGAATATAITPVTQTINGAHADGGLIAVEAGLTRLDPPDAAWAAGVNEVYFVIAATGMQTQHLLVELTDADPSTAPSTPTQIATAVLGAVVEQDASAADVTVQASLRISNAALAGKSTNGGKTYRNLADTKNRVAATVDGSYNRTAVTRDLT